MTIFGGGQQKQAPLIGDSGIPAYCLKKIGSRHILVAGGGGASKTGVQNEIQTHLFTTGSANKDVGFQAQLVDTFDTGSMATMNMDVACAVDENAAKYVIAAGQDDNCVLYMTRKFRLNELENDSLCFEISKVAQVRSDYHSTSAYQKCVRFDKNSRGKIFATGGADGYIRLWDAQVVFRAENENAQPVLKIQAHKADVDDIDFSSDSNSIISVGAEGAFLWSKQTGERLLDLQFPIEIARGFKMRSARCTPLGNANGSTVFVAAYNSISRGSKDQACYLSLWTFNSQRKVARPIVTKLIAKNQAISSLAVSDCGNYTAVGTMSGGVGVFDTHEFRRLYFAPESHGLFVTGIEFVSKVAPSNCEDIRQETPGIASGFRCAVVTLAADKTMQLHRVPHAQPQPFSEFLFIISFISLIFTWLASFLIVV
ncbi:hypothetical protein GCK72_002652 [Caenorhabditis remanei]|uniref:Uncharacterized protein n=1 Tax=Caenorhabditis remanei TaxID=31234 RepID=A0A6A5HSD2_CAERE|nr:hypothetical protein GCK72_002652 [Caenorhabditis remanei]KAF1770828.1 hypothetical protein GCK72_002652 [Caenorhabditis remanei]